MKGNDMRCDICDRLLTEPVYNRDHEKWEPCRECLDVIEDTLNAFRDRPSMDEDEPGFGLDDQTLPKINDLYDLA